MNSSDTKMRSYGERSEAPQIKVNIGGHRTKDQKYTTNCKLFSTLFLRIDVVVVKAPRARIQQLAVQYTFRTFG